VAPLLVTQARPDLQTTLASKLVEVSLLNSAVRYVVQAPPSSTLNRVTQVLELSSLSGSAERQTASGAHVSPKVQLPPAGSQSTHLDVVISQYEP